MPTVKYWTEAEEADLWKVQSKYTRFSTPENIKAINEEMVLLGHASRPYDSIKTRISKLRKKAGVARKKSRPVKHSLPVQQSLFESHINVKKSTLLALRAVFETAMEVAADIIEKSLVQRGEEKDRRVIELQKENKMLYEHLNRLKTVREAVENYQKSTRTLM